VYESVCVYQCVSTAERLQGIHFGSRRASTHKFINISCPAGQVMDTLSINGA